ncbi:MAG TPA: SDR family oxidoreductase [Thermoleophilaceae bacterium]|jgi:NAD(P)-dependent dehydrogenase (short-subunit alcohol dehydrogenase family)
MAEGAVVIVGGTAGIGRVLAQSYVDDGREVVITGRDAERAQSVAGELGASASGAGFDLADPHCIADALAHVGTVDHLVLAAIERDVNTVREYDIDRAIRLATLKLVGYAEVLHCLHPKLHDDSSVLLFGGLAKERPYPGSTTVTSVNGAVETMVRTFATELAPIRVNALHPGIVGDSPYWEGNDAVIEATKARTPTGRLATMADVSAAARFLLENRSVNGVNLAVDGGWVIL